MVLSHGETADDGYRYSHVPTTHWPLSQHNGPELGAKQFIFLLSLWLGVSLPLEQAITMEIIPVPGNPLYQLFYIQPMHLKTYCAPALAAVCMLKRAN